jgi:NtrC-family two-component system sensor histidine kinase KinB
LARPLQPLPGKRKSMLRLRQKISLGFGGLLIIILLIGIQSILQLSRLGDSIDVILRENYRSVIACQEIKEALERIDSGILFSLQGYTQKGYEQIRINELAFEKALQVELNNITLPGEGEKATWLQKNYNQYKMALKDIVVSPPSLNQRRQTYFNELLPLFDRIKGTANEILQMNQQNMHDANNRARRSAATAKREMFFLLLAGMIIAVGFLFFFGKWVLRPIDRLIRSTEEIRKGNLDLVVQISSRDEIGLLYQAFNDMATSLREFRRSDQAHLIRIQQATQQAFNSLPEAIAVIDLEGKVEVATEKARNSFGLQPNISLSDLPFDWMTDFFHEAIKQGRTVTQKNSQGVFQHFIQGEERYFHPEAVPILDRDRQPTGVVMVLQDVTQLRQQDEIKRGMISTVSHQLKTPLTSIRMAIHLLLEEKIGPLSEKQVDLLLAAREDSDRLHNILNNLLDISRIESGKTEMEFQALSPNSLQLEALEPFWRAAHDQGVILKVEVPGDLPEVWADPTRIYYVFGNLLSNALKYTPPGGKVTVSAGAEKNEVRFSISDTGKGIPGQYLPRIFEQFFRVPTQEKESGAGLGLAIVKEIIEAHGGQVGVESQEGKGSTFTFTLRTVDHTSKKEEHS